MSPTENQITDTGSWGPIFALAKFIFFIRLYYRKKGLCTDVTLTSLRMPTLVQAATCRLLQKRYCMALIHQKQRCSDQNRGTLITA